eukprot:gnl/TRDRNA2_/TRDRNA2_208818_c0_seq1.p1 gnl/TRDRNA2_/TRDRNA2_208818_c0~~gnl/TRDRNA2_/TRDRNA2_208818_c0_seq1.p1  ORF type:complete len:162 (+),score=27.77 gnl/TRDRNA2_/TRDRNA2_208818_c0_seq1:92-577(+)
MKPSAMATAQKLWWQDVDNEAALMNASFGVLTEPHMMLGSSSESSTVQSASGLSSPNAEPDNPDPQSGRSRASRKRLRPPKHIRVRAKKRQSAEMITYAGVVQLQPEMEPAYIRVGMGLDNHELPPHAFGYPVEHQLGDHPPYGEHAAYDRIEVWGPVFSL